LLQEESTRVHKMADSGNRICTSGTDDSSIGDTAWTNPQYITTDDTSRATFKSGSGTPIENSIKIIKADGSLGTEDKSTGGLWPTPEAVKTYGAANDLWSESWTAENINDSDFGIAISMKGATSGVSHWLKAQGFGFSIPTGATINGILVSVTCYYIGGATRTALADCVYICVYYTEGGSGGTNLQVQVGDVFRPVSEIHVNVNDVWRPATAFVNVGDVWRA